MSDNKTSVEKRSSWSNFGPGVLVAGSAVGTSHIVQSTRAGADFGLGFLIVFILIALVKYPGTRFGKDYADATGKSLLDNYTSYGWVVISLYSIVIFLTLAFVSAALGLVSASILNALLPLNINSRYLTVGILAVSGCLLMLGKYSFLEKLNKVLVPAFTILILATTAIVANQTDWSAINWAFPAANKANLIYLIAIAGWLLAPMEVSVFLSFWTNEKAKTRKAKTLGADKSVNNFDFNLGYWMSLVLALCFLLMGASLLSDQASELPSAGGAFIQEIIKLFSNALGDWSYSIIAFIAMTVMYSTLLTVMDGYARNVQVLLKFTPARHVKNLFNVGVLSVTISGILVILLFMNSFTTFIDLVGILVFVLAPIYAILNHKAVFGPDIAPDKQPSNFMKVASLAGIIVMSLVAVSYLYLRFAG